VVQVGGFLADSIRTKNEQLITLSDNITQDMQYEIEQVNNLFEQLADVNKNLTRSWVETSVERNQLLDRKDTLVDQLTAKMDFQIVPQQDGSVNLYVNGSPIFYKDTFRTVEMDNATGKLYLNKEGVREDPEITLKGGKMRGYLNTRDNLIPNYQDWLGDFASDLAANVNQIHQNGYDKNGTAGIAFFTGDPVTGIIDAGNITVNVALGSPTTGDPMLVAASLGSITSETHVNKNYTTDFEMTGNLNDGDVGDTYQATVPAYDSLGAKTNIKLNFTKTASGPPDTWDFTVTPATAPTSGTLTFDGSGNFVSSTLASFTYTPPNVPPATITVALDFGGSTQNATGASTLSGKGIIPVIDGTASIALESDKFRAAFPSTGLTGTGSFLINDQTITWETTDSIQDVVNRINNFTPSAGHPGPGVKASWNADLQKIELIRDPTVNAGVPPPVPPAVWGPSITVSDVAGAGNFTTFMDLSSANLNTNNEGSGNNALAMSQLWHRKITTLNGVSTLNDEYLGLADSVAKDKSLIDNLYTNKKRLVDNVLVQRSEEGTVSLDEEMINIMKYQQAYGATSRLITIADEMLDRLINSTGTVGR
jgi:flagellar hook-associated protein 1 FlgK